MENGQPDFVTKLRAQIEGQIHKLQEERATLEPRMNEIDGEIEERRAAIRRLIGAPEPRKASARTPVSDEAFLEAVTRQEGEFTLRDVGDQVGLSPSRVKERLAKMADLVEMVHPGGPGVPSRYCACAAKGDGVSGA